VYFGCSSICGKKEGKIVKGGAFTDPGGDACPRSSSGGKHKYKFGRCAMVKNLE
jgi:hypothetical protein